MEPYLDFSDEEIQSLNPKGLGKLLLVRREMIYLKNIMRQATADRERAEALFATLGVGWPDYMRLMSLRMRKVLKARRAIPGFERGEHMAVFQDHDALALLRQHAVPFMAVFDFDRTLTSKAFHPVAKDLLRQYQEEGQFWVCSAHGQPEVLLDYLRKHQIAIRQSRVRATGGVAAKLQLLWHLAMSSDRALMLHFDDEPEPCASALLMGYHSYRVQKPPAPLLRRVGFDRERVR